MEVLHHLSVSEVFFWERAVLNAALERLPSLRRSVYFSKVVPQSTVMKITFRVRCLNERA